MVESGLVMFWFYGGHDKAQNNGLLLRFLRIHGLHHSGVEGTRQECDTHGAGLQVVCMCLVGHYVLSCRYKLTSSVNT